MQSIRGLRKYCGCRRWEAGGIRFLLHEQLAGKLFDDTALAVMVNECVMLLGGGLGQRLEPVGIVTGAIVDSPAHHAVGNAVSHFQRKRLLVVYRVNKHLVCLLGEILKHLLAVEHLFGVIDFRAFCRNLNRDCFAVESFLDYVKS